MKKLLSGMLSFFLIGSIMQPLAWATQYEEAIEELLFMEMPTVISASAKAESIEDAPANVYVITGQEMVNRGYTSVFDLIKDLPGVTYDNQIGNEKNGAPIIRGLVYARRLKVYLNGMDLGEKSSSGYGWDHRLPIEGIDRVEFILGPYASLYGRNSFSGVINIITKDGQQVDGLITNSLYGSWDRLQGTVIYGKKLNTWDIYFSLFKNHSSEGQDLTKEYPEIYARENREGILYPTKGNTPDFTNVSPDFYLPWDANDIYLKVKSDNGLYFQYQWYETDWPGVGTFITPMFYYQTKDIMCVERSFAFQAGYKLEGDKLTSDTSVHYNDWMRLNELGYLSNNRKVFEYDVQGWAFDQNIRWTASDWNSVYMGVSYEDVNSLIPKVGMVAPLVPAARPEKKSEDYLALSYLNVTFQDEIKLKDNLMSVVGVMYERSNTHDDIFLPRVSLMWSANDKTDIKFLYGGGYIVPEMISRTDQLNIKGNDKLKPETLTSYELNAIYKLADRTRMSASVYLNQVKDVIAVVNDSSLPASFVQTYKNLGNKETKGLELTFDLGITDRIKMWASYAYVSGYYEIINRTTGAKTKIKELPMSSKHHGKLGINCLVLQDKLNVYLYDLYKGKQDTWDAGRSVGSYNIVNINCTTTPILSKSWRFSIGIENLLDRKAFDSNYQASWDFKPDAPIKRRNFNVQVGYKF